MYLQAEYSQSGHVLKVGRHLQASCYSTCNGMEHLAGSGVIMYSVLLCTLLQGFEGYLNTKANIGKRNRPKAEDKGDERAFSLSSRNSPVVRSILYYERRDY
jgi:hypothetical protein